MSGQNYMETDDSIRICIMRHGMAEDFASQDARRQLVAIGKQQVVSTNHWFRNQFSQSYFDIAIVSPYIRAQQTYDLFSKNMRVGQVIDCADIVPSGTARSVQDYLHVLATTELEDGQLPSSILVVSHMPFVSLLLQQLTNRSRADIFNTGALAVVDCNRESLQGNLTAIFQG